MSSNYSVSLLGPAPWGFRLQGGKDFNMPLTISRLTDLGKAAKARIAVGDVVLSIDGISTDGMNHLEAQNKIKACAGNLNLTLQRASTIPKPAVAPKVEPSEIIKPVAIISHHPNHHHPTEPTSLTPSAAHNKTARPFGGCGGEDRDYPIARSPHSAFIPSASSAFTPATLARTPPPPQPLFPFSSCSSPPSLPAAPQPSVYNTPFNLYSNENACEVAMGQRRGLTESQGGAVQLNGVPRRPILETDIEFYHVPSHGDASKKRLMEDTEDWRPRSGTTQSRSFRILAQITGTEHQQAQESDAENKTNEEVEEPETTSHMSSAVKTMTKGPAGSPNNSITFTTTQGSGFPKPGLQTCFGMRGNGTTSVLSKGPVPERPAPQPHPKDQDTLVQMAEHIPAGTRTPMCGHCNMDIRGPFLVAMGKSWHPEEFNCAHCRTSLADIGFVEEQGSVYCEHCYEDFFAPSCSRCQLKILGEVINALKQTWHIHCFLCASCQQPIRNNTFHLEDGEPYCERDYYSLFGTGCHGCEFPIEAGDKFLEALGFTWHDTCFVCVICCTTLEGQAFFSKMDKPLCRKHAHSVVKI
ncbi:PDZ and LIM domain protein 5a isoform X6 [Salmo salar]|uniref:PDZ and LIM domain protein 5a isoform X6 n=1 Tax=Salmo salar TaxID=8030 RepID=A0A1S3PKR9_SALSA|nr:PDZ and LIM domain protein 5a isoform X6 [Salmo salar]|eukprot:XP_014027954.1 PREDICTED: PDZ and LIM domain protein 5 isoform X11 [Salmo salar]